MGRNRLPYDKKKIRITLRIRRELVEKLRKMDNYNRFIENLIDEALK